MYYLCFFNFSASLVIHFIHVNDTAVRVIPHPFRDSSYVDMIHVTIVHNRWATFSTMYYTDDIAPLITENFIIAKFIQLIFQYIGYTFFFTGQ